MTTKRESIIAAMVNQLSGTTNVSDRIYRSRVVPLQRNESPALVIEPIADTPDENIATPYIDWSLTVRVSVIVRADIPDQVADPIVESVHKKLMDDLSLSNNAIDIRPGNTNFELVDADKPAGVIGMDYIVRYRTSLTDLATSP